MYNKETLARNGLRSTAQKTKFSIKDFFSKCDQIRSYLRIWSHLLMKWLLANFIFVQWKYFKKGFCKWYSGEWPYRKVHEVYRIMLFVTEPFYNKVITDWESRIYDPSKNLRWYFFEEIVNSSYCGLGHIYWRNT